MRSISSVVRSHAPTNKCKALTSRACAARSGSAIRAARLQRRHLTGATIRSACSGSTMRAGVKDRNGAPLLMSAATGTNPRRVVMFGTARPGGCTCEGPAADERKESRPGRRRRAGARSAAMSSAPRPPGLKLGPFFSEMRGAHDRSRDRPAVGSRQHLEARPAVSRLPPYSPAAR